MIEVEAAAGITLQVRKIKRIKSNNKKGKTENKMKQVVIFAHPNNQNSFNKAILEHVLSRAQVGAETWKAIFMRCNLIRCYLGRNYKKSKYYTGRN